MFHGENPNFPSRLKTKLVNSNSQMFKFQSLDIATLQGAEGPQRGPQGPKGPKGPPALCGS